MVWLRSAILCKDVLETPLKLVPSTGEGNRVRVRDQPGASIQSHLIGDRTVVGEQLSSSSVSVTLTGSKLGSVWTRSGRLNPFQGLTHELPQ